MPMVQFNIRVETEELKELRQLVDEFNQSHPDTPTTLQGMLRGAVRQHIARIKAQLGQAPTGSDT